MQALDPAVTVSRMRVTRQTGTECQPDFIASNGTNNELLQTASGSQNGVNWIRVTTNGFSNFYLHSTRSRLTTKVFLQGAYNTTLGRHKDVTPAWATILNTSARNQPYNTPVFGNYAGTESVPPGFFKSTAGDTDIVDWILLEVKTSAGSLLSKRAAFVREDGLIVDLDGISPVYMYGVGGGSYNISIRHRNHLGVRTSSLQQFSSVKLGVVPTLLTYDFSTSQSKAYQNSLITGNAAMKDIGGGKFGLWGGNANGANGIRVSGPLALNDYLYMVNNTLGGSWSSVLSNVYNTADLNLDGSVRATGGALINDYIGLVNVSLGGNWLTVILEHL